MLPFFLQKHSQSLANNKTLLDFYHLGFISRSHVVGAPRSCVQIIIYSEISNKRMQLR